MVKNSSDIRSYELLRYPPTWWVVSSCIVLSFLFFVWFSPQLLMTVAIALIVLALLCIWFWLASRSKFCRAWVYQFRDQA